MFLFILVYLLYVYFLIIRTSEVFVRTSRILGLAACGQVRFYQISRHLQDPCHLLQGQGNTWRYINTKSCIFEHKLLVVMSGL